MLTACSTSPLHIGSAACAEPPAISADASYMPGKTGSSSVPRPKPVKDGSRAGLADGGEVVGVVDGEQLRLVGRRRAR